MMHFLIFLKKKCISAHGNTKKVTRNMALMAVIYENVNVKATNHPKYNLG